MERSGRELGRELGQRRDRTPAEELFGRTLTALGFAPQRKRRKSGRVTFTLGNCPYRDAVRENQEVVCTMHRGLTRGMLDAFGRSAKLTEFVPMEP